jgi:hypothetical protein
MPGGHGRDHRGGRVALLTRRSYRCSMAKLFYVLVTLLNLTLFCGAIYFIGSRGFAPAAGWSAVEVVTVVLAALAVLMTVLGIFIAVLAVWGYARLADDARNAAILAARDATSNLVPLVVREEIDRQMGSGRYGEAAGEDTSSQAIGGNDGR